MSEVNPAVYPLADWLVGPFGADEQAIRSGEGLEPWRQPFYKMAVSALQRVCGKDDIPQGWMPTPQEGAELYRELSYERKLHSMAGGLKAYIAERPEGSAIARFRNNQHEIAERLGEVFDGVNINKPIIIKSPTASGKTPVIVGLTEGLRYHNPDVSILELVPRKDILLGMLKAFRQFSKDIDPAVYFGESKDIGKVTIMTYQSFNNAYKKGIITRDMFDAVIRDESHRAHGEATGRALQEFCFGSEDGRHLAVFDMSATPKVAEEKLDYSKSIIEGISEGLLSPVSARSVYTRSQIHETGSFRNRNDFSKIEMHPLIDDKERNKKIIHEITSGLASGRRAIARLVPGDNLRHPQVIKEMLDRLGKVHIVNPYMGDHEYRPINSVILRGDMSMATRNKIYQIFSEDYNFDLDVLLFVETIKEGWDGPIAKKLVNAAPTRQAWVTEQLLGRVMRKYQRHNGEVVTAEAVDLIDESISGQVSFTDILNRDAPAGMMYREGVTIGSNLIDYHNPQRGPMGAFESMVK